MMEAVAASEWKFDPAVIFQTWTEEYLVAMFKWRTENVERRNRRESGEPEDESMPGIDRLREISLQRELASQR